MFLTISHIACMPASFSMGRITLQSHILSPSLHSSSPSHMHSLHQQFVSHTSPFSVLHPVGVHRQGSFTTQQASAFGQHFTHHGLPPHTAVTQPHFAICQHTIMFSFPLQQVHTWQFMARLVFTLPWGCSCSEGFRSAGGTHITATQRHSHFQAGITPSFPGQFAAWGVQFRGGQPCSPPRPQN